MSATQSKTASIRNFKESGERKAQKAASSPLMETLTRIGYGARGLIYMTMGYWLSRLRLEKAVRWQARRARLPRSANNPQA